MKRTLAPVLIISALALTPAPTALAQGCCGTKTADAHGSCARDLATSAACSAQPQPVKPVFAEPVQSVFDNYIKIQTALAQDSLGIVPDAAKAMAAAIRADGGKNLSADLVAWSESLAKADSLQSARAAFKSVSDPLVGYIQRQKAAAGTYHVAYCPMAKASWVQTGKDIVNPYMGKSMVACGQFKS